MSEEAGSPLNTPSLSLHSRMPPMGSPCNEESPYVVLLPSPEGTSHHASALHLPGDASCSLLLERKGVFHIMGINSTMFRHLSSPTDCTSLPGLGAISHNSAAQQTALSFPLHLFGDRAIPPKSMNIKMCKTRIEPMCLCVTAPSINKFGRVSYSAGKQQGKKMGVAWGFVSFFG